MRGGYFGTRPFGVPGCLLGWAAPWAAAHASCPALRAWPLCVPVGGGPPARSPHASLRLGSVDLEARPGPAAAHRHRGQAHRQGGAMRSPLEAFRRRVGALDGAIPQTTVHKP